MTSGSSGARQRILDAAVRRIAREGLDEVRIARIAMDAGVSSALVHYHFASREALLAEALEHSYEIAGESRIGALEPGRDPVETLQAMIEQCLPLPGALRDDWLLWVELWLRAARRPELRPTATRLYERLHAWFAEEIAAGVAAGAWTSDDVDRSTDLVLAVIDGYGVRCLAGDPRLDADAVRAAVWRAAAAELGLL